MKKMFLRDAQLKFMVVTCVYCVLSLAAGLFVRLVNGKGISYHDKIGSTIICIGCVLMAIDLLILIYIPDFIYSIKVDEKTFDIIFPPKERKTLRRKFTITKHFNNVTLNDGSTTVDLYYNKELLDFLHQIQES